MNHQSPTLASQATAELPKLPPSCAHVWTWRAEHPGKYDAFLDNANEPYFTADQMNAHYLAGVEAGRASRAQSEWQPIETAPKEGRTMFVVRGFDVTNPDCGAHQYTTDPYCVWPGDEGGWVRWPHAFRPTHWMPLPATLGETK